VPFDDIATPVGGRVEPAWSPAAGPASFAGGDLIGLLRDHDLDASGVQRPAVGAGRVRLVGEHCVWCGARTTSAQAGDADVGQDRAEQGTVVAVSAGDDRGERAATPVDGGVDLRGQPAPGASDAVTCRFTRLDR